MTHLFTNETEEDPTASKEKKKVIVEIKDNS